MIMYESLEAMGEVYIERRIGRDKRVVLIFIRLLMENWKKGLNEVRESVLVVLTSL